MRCDQNIRRCPQWIVSRQWLRVGDVERCTAYLTIVECLDKCGLVDDLAASNVCYVGATGVGFVK
jgi:hypothetical protein